MEAQALLDFGASTCFINKKLVQQYKLALVKKNTLMPMEVIDGRRFSSRPVTHEAKALGVTINSHTNKVVFNVIPSPRNPIIIGLSWLVFHNPQLDWIMRSLTLKRQSTRP
jgi:hypothetical protein